MFKDETGTGTGPSTRTVRLMVLGGCVATLMLVAGLGSATSDGRARPAAGSPVTATVTATATTTVTPTVPVTVPASSPRKRCQEDDPCWNSCTMGVDGRYPTTDPRYYLPGPCVLGPQTVLPYGRYLAVEVTPLAEPAEPFGPVCGDGTSGRFYALVSAFVREADGRLVPDSRVSISACVLPAPYELSDDVNGALPLLLRAAAAHA